MHTEKKQSFNYSQSLNNFAKMADKTSRQKIFSCSFQRIKEEIVLKKLRITYKTVSCLDYWNKNWHYRKNWFRTMNLDKKVYHFSSPWYMIIFHLYWIKNIKLGNILVEKTPNQFISNFFIFFFNLTPNSRLLLIYSYYLFLFKQISLMINGHLT